MINLGFQAGFSLYLQIWMCLDCSCPAYLKLLVTCAVLLWEMRSECLSSFQPFKSLAPCFSWCISLSASLWKNQQTCSVLQFPNCTYSFHLLNIFNHSMPLIRLEHGKYPCRLQAATSAIVSFWQNWRMREEFIPYCSNEGNTALTRYPTEMHIHFKKLIMEHNLALLP